MPYVHKDCVYLFKGDEFGVSLQMDGKSVKSVSYQPDMTKADVTLKFTQVAEDGEEPMMMLTIKNRTKEKIYVDALMTVPGKKGILKTSVLPLDPGLAGFESWPHPVVQLVLKNIRTTEKNQVQQGGASDGDRPAKLIRASIPPRMASNVKSIKL